MFSELCQKIELHIALSQFSDLFILQQNQSPDKPEGLQQILDNELKALGGENPNVLCLFFV